MSSPISETIADLASRRCINAISCMAVFPDWERDARLIARFGGKGPGGIQVGLHLVLAGEQPITTMRLQGLDGRLPSADRMKLLAWAGRLDLSDLSREIDAQFAAFTNAMGKAPDFVDAHQHVHVLPGIRRCVIDATLRHAPGAWIRNPADGTAAALRRPFAGKAIGSNVHALGLGTALAWRGIASNDSFAGHYDYQGDYAALLPRFFKSSGVRHLIMCHPGSGQAKNDSIASARIVEAAVLGEMSLMDRLTELRLRRAL